jgi:hypothetical protein
MRMILNRYGALVNEVYTRVEAGSNTSTFHEEGTKRLRALPCHPGDLVLQVGGVSNLRQLNVKMWNPTGF